MSFKERDLPRALRGTAKAGHRAQRVEIDKSGKIVVVIEHGEQPDTPAEPEANEWDAA